MRSEEQQRPGRCTAIELNPDGTIRTWNALAAELTGTSPGEAIGSKLGSLLVGEYEGDPAAALSRAEASGAPREPESVPVRPKGRKQVWLTLTLHPLERGRVVGVLGEAIRPEEVARPLLELLGNAWGRLREGMALTTADEDPEGPRILVANDAFCRLFGLAREKVAGVPLASALDEGRGPEVLARIREGFAQGWDAISDTTLVGNASGDPFLVEWEVTPIRDAEGRIVNFVSVQRDVTADAAHDKRRHSAGFDALTGLPNRAHFLTRLERSVERAANGGQCTFGVIGLEIEGLDGVARTWGPLISHFVLESVILRAKERLRPGDLVARVADHRLAVLLEHFDPWGEVDAVLDRLRMVAGAPYLIGKESISLDVIGETVPLWYHDRFAGDAQEVMDEMELTLWRASSRSTAEDAPDTRKPVRKAPPYQLSNALEESQLRLRYLPLISIADGSVVGLEVLLRWLHPERGLMDGGQFIGDAERAGLMTSFGEWVIGRACRQLKVWQRSLPEGRVPPLHVNVSSAELWHTDFAGRIERQVIDLDLDPTSLRLEIPEAALAANRGATRDLLARLTGIGVELWLDGFGRGGLPLADLPALPLSHLKLDRTMAWSHGREKHRPAPLLHGLVGLAHDLGWQVTAGGVETPDQRDVLRQEQCDVGQGFFFSAPVDAEGVLALL